MRVEKMACVASSARLAQDSLEILAARYPFVSVDEADVIVALGGDGFLLHALHTYVESGKPIYGMNRGTVGFLMNEFRVGELSERIAAALPSALCPLGVRVLTSAGAEHHVLAFNEAAVIRYSGQSANIRVVVNGRTRIDELVCDGVLVATPAGSTAYNFSAGGPVLPLGSDVLALTPVSPFRPRRWHGALLPRDCTVELFNLDPEKRPLGAAGDGHEVVDAVAIAIAERPEHAVTLLFDPERTLEERVFMEQFAY